jgi:hypothetical protein
MSILPRIMPRSYQERIAAIRKKLLRREAVIGGEIFGEIPAGHQREFFCMDKHTWVWHEAWTDENGNNYSINTRYDVRPDGVFKSQNGSGYQKLSSQEARNLYFASDSYLKLMKAEYQTAR